MGSRLKLMLVRSFSTTSRPALRAAASGGRPRAGSDTTGTGTALTLPRHGSPTGMRHTTRGATHGSGRSYLPISAYANQSAPTATFALLKRTNVLEIRTAPDLLKRPPASPEPRFLLGRPPFTFREASSAAQHSCTVDEQFPTPMPARHETVQALGEGLDSSASMK